MSGFTPDRFDKAILSILQADAKVPLRLIGEKVNLSAAAVQRRIRRLEDEAVIERQVVHVDPQKVGRPITLIIEIHTERTQMADLDAMKTQLTAPEVQQCYYVTGDADFMLVITVTSMTEYEDLARRLFYNNPNIKWFRSTVVLDRVKTGMSVPVK